MKIDGEYGCFLLFKLVEEGGDVIMLCYHLIH